MMAASLGESQKGGKQMTLKPMCVVQQWKTSPVYKMWQLTVYSNDYNRLILITLNAVSKCVAGQMMRQQHTHPQLMGQITVC